MATSTQRLSGAVKSRLETQLPPEVAAQGLPAIKQFSRHSPAKIQPQKAPQVWVSVVQIRPGGPASFGGPSQNQTRGRTVLVGVTAAGPDSDVAAERLEGYADLILKVMEADQTANGEGHRVRCLQVDFSPNFGQGTALYQEAVLTFEITRWAGLGED